MGSLLRVMDLFIDNVKTTLHFFCVRITAGLCLFIHCIMVNIDLCRVLYSQVYAAIGENCCMTEVIVVLNHNMNGYWEGILNRLIGYNNGHG